MKKSNFILLLIAMVVPSLMFQGCSEEFNYTLIVVDNASMFLNESVNIEINSGNGKYRVKSLNEDIARVSVKESTIRIFGQGDGTTDVIVTDATGQTATIEVLVGPLHHSITNNLIESQIDKALMHFGLTTEREVDKITGKTTFTIKEAYPNLSHKLSVFNFSHDKPIDSNGVIQMLQLAKGVHSFDIVMNENDEKVQQTFGVIDRDTNFLVFMEISRSTNLEGEPTTKFYCKYLSVGSK